ncbi:MAG TPA: ABC transporter ATP-binding protein [Methanobacterium sp.]|nr:ABC transporter ATP-binding protein [Methanobacterium sp.]
MEYAILTSSLTKEFGEFKALNGLNLKVKKGEIYGLLGPNGAGKTTAIKVLCGLLTPSSGETYVLGNKVPDKNTSSLLGYMPQETALYVGLTVHQNMKFFGNLFGMNDELIEERESELLKFVDLYKWKDELVEKLSGGMKHRASLACTLMHGPELLFLDEPTVGVDPELRISFWDYFNNLKDAGTTILITTHYMDEARRCDRVGFVNHGELIAEGTPQEILDRAGTDSLEDAFLEFSRKEAKNETL